ncbi:hypothetical protein PRZ48_004215 [Zasmidium cellare]|uniref:Uncharacterized protein n=1 Tax=Zasmidium cellare TaxID=395010 RepID=A0ABR0EYV6_ZASCE|nr:hypothetical protein PRZ48_004215 [Zasmidium cellare]
MSALAMDTTAQSDIALVVIDATKRFVRKKKIEDPIDEDDFEDLDEGKDSKFPKKPIGNEEGTLSLDEDLRIEAPIFKSGDKIGESKKSYFYSNSYYNINIFKGNGSLLVDLTFDEDGNPSPILDK